MSKKRTHNPNWQDNTRKERALKRQSQDDAWSARISGGKYPTLRKLMTAIHKGEITLVYATFVPDKKGKQS
jgi:hypothetical protein